MAKIETPDALREIYGHAKGRAVTKQLDRLDVHCRRFIELSPFLVLATSRTDGLGDASPKGDHPGFVQVLDDKTLAIPDRPGNNRLDSMENLLENPSVGLIFFIPGVDETLRINGTAEIRDDSDLVSRFENEGKTPKTVLVIKVAEAYLHCAKALMRSEIVVAGFASRGTAAAQLRSNDQGPDRRQGTGGKPRRHGPALPKNPLLTKKPGPGPGFWILLSASVSDGNAASR